VGIEAISCLRTNLPSAATVFLTNANVLVKCCILLCCAELKLNTFNWVYCLLCGTCTSSTLCYVYVVIYFIVALVMVSVVVVQNMVH